ncbi:MAG: ATP-binding protein [Proteobacteria bacterium]|nr:ATP-binding protein [Pseudomonadota bacterium]
MSDRERISQREAIDYSKWRKRDLIKELRRRDGERLALRGTFDSFNLLEVIHSAQTDFVTVDSERNIFHRMLDNFLNVTRSEYGFIHEMLRTDDGKMYLEARSITNIAWDEQSRAIYAKLLSGEMKFDNLNSLYGAAMRTGEPVIANDAVNDPRRGGTPAGHPAINAFLGLPLHAGGEYVGMLGLANAPGGYSEDLIDRLKPLTKICAIIMLSFKIDQIRKRAQQALTRKSEELEVANRELEGFSYSVSHDLRAPLRAIDGFARAFEDDYGDKVDDEGRRLIGVIRRSTSKMGRLIEDLLGFSRMSRRVVRLQQIDMTALARAAFQQAKAQEPDRQVDLRLSVLPPVAGDLAMLRQVWVNLLSNAVKYTRTREGAVIEIGSRSESGETRFWVRDNGVGFDPRYSHKLFGVFQRLHSERDYEGTGVGLALAQRIIRRHGGRIWAKSTPGNGATFEFALPQEESNHG